MFQVLDLKGSLLFLTADVLYQTQHSVAGAYSEVIRLFIFCLMRLGNNQTRQADNSDVPRCSQSQHALYLFSNKYTTYVTPFDYAISKKFNGNDGDCEAPPDDGHPL